MLIDDFIGTGDAGLECLEYIGQTVEVDKIKLSILILVSQDEGLKKLQEKGVKVYTACNRKRDF